MYSFVQIAAVQYTHTRFTAGASLGLCPALSTEWSSFIKQLSEVVGSLMNQVLELKPGLDHKEF